MSARDDYPPMTGTQYEAMCNEIDQLRVENRHLDDLRAAQLTKMQADDMVRRAVGQLVKELTVHADAMRGLIGQLRDGEIGDGCEGYVLCIIDPIIEAYDNFIGEA